MSEEESNLGLFFEKSLNATAAHTIVLDDRGEPCDYIFDIVNPAFVAMTGLRKQDIIGKNALSVLPHLEAEWINRYGQVALTGVSQEFQSYSSDLGKWFRVNAFQHKPGGFAVSFIDITDLVTERHHSDQAEEKYKTLFEMGAAKLIVEPNTGAILEANHIAAEFYQYSVDELKNMHIDQMNTMSRDQIYVAMESARSQRREYFEFKHRLKDGQIRDVEVHTSHIRLSDQEALFSIVFDVTERNFLRTKAMQNERLATIGTMMSSLNHEFNNLLAILSAQFDLAQLMLPVNEVASRVKKNVEHQFQRFKALSDSIKRLYNHDALQRKRVCISQVIEDVLELATALDKTRRIEFRFEPVQDSIVEIDLALVQQVFLNIVKNAIHALEGVSSPEIGLVLDSTPAEAIVRISNNGAVIPEAVRPRLFTPFFTTKKDEADPGSGLGLAFSQSVIDRHGGILLLEEQERTTFQIRLPKASTPRPGTREMSVSWQNPSTIRPPG